MKRTNSQSISEVLGDFLSENKQLREKILEIRIERAWGEVLGPMVMQYTRNVYVRYGVLYVSLTSAVLRNELSMCKERLVVSLNKYAGAEVIKELIIR